MSIMIQSCKLYEGECNGCGECILRQEAEDVELSPWEKEYLDCDDSAIYTPGE